MFLRSSYEVHFDFRRNYRLCTVNLNMVNSKFHLIQSFFENFAKLLSFPV